MKSNGLTMSTVVLFAVAFLAACSSGTPRLRSITVTPATSTIAKSAPSAAHRTRDAVLDTLQYTATGLLSDGSTADETSSVTWSSSNTGAATISATGGLATAAGPGTTTITATLAGISGTASLTVTSVVSVAVMPVNPTIAGSATEQFIATATITNADGTTGTMDVSGDAGTTWASATPGVATINSTGLATGVSTGTSVISAKFGNATGSTTLTVVAGPVSLVLTPATPNIAVSNSVAFTVQEMWSDNSLHNPAGAVTFSSGTPANATISATTGVALGVAVGTSTITAMEGATLTGTATLTVVAANARFAYVANTNDSTIEGYTVDAAAGTFTTPTTVAAGQPQQVIVHPNGLYVYCICGDGSGTLTFADLYNVTPGTGVLTAATPAITAVVGTGGADRGVMDPTGQFMFVADGGSPPALGSVQSFSVSQTDGSLTLVSNLAAGVFPIDVKIDQTGKYLYVVNNGDSTVSQYSVAADGTLAPLTPPTVSTGLAGPSFSTIDPANKYLYVPNTGDNTVSIFPIDSSTGLLGTPATATITGASSVANVAVDPTNKYVYVLDSTGATTGHLYGYNTGVGVLGSALAGSPFALAASGDGESPTGIAIDPTGALVAVDNNFSNDISLMQSTAGVLAPSPTSPAATGNAPNFVVFYIAP